MSAEIGPTDRLIAGRLNSGMKAKATGAGEQQLAVLLRKHAVADARLRDIE